MAKLIYAFDVGMASLGWAIIRIITGQAPEIIACGSHIFPSGRDDKTRASKASDRRSHRLMRRQTRRKARRKAKVANAIRRYIAPKFNPASMLIDPIDARAGLVKPDCDPARIGGLQAFASAIWHLARQRGQRKPPKPGSEHASRIEPPSEHPPRSMHRGEERARLRAMGVWSKINRKDPRTGEMVANERVEDSKPKREHLIAEFKAIFATGRRWMPDRFTPEVEAELIETIFYQRPVNPGNRGPCAYMPAEIRTWKHDPAFQRFRIRKELADLRFVSPDHPRSMMPPEVIDDIETDLLAGARRTWAQIERRLRKAIPQASLESEALAKEGKQSITPAIDPDDEDGVSMDTAAVSERAAILLYERMKSRHCDEHTAADTLAAERDDFEIGRIEIERIAPGDRLLDIAELEAIVNDPIIDPTTRTIYSQTKKVIDRLIDRFGKPDRINIESAKGIGKGKAAAKEGLLTIKELETRSKAAAERAAKFKAGGSIDDRVFRSLGRKCFFTGSTDNLEIGHLLPRSLTGDNSFFNKVPISRAANAQMGDRTPAEFMQDDPDIANRVRARLYALKKSDPAHYRGIAWRFEDGALDSYDRGFSADALTAGRYAEKLLRVGLAPVCSHIVSIRGRMTAKGRYIYGLEKDRGDHRHHAQDAVVIALARPEKMGEARITSRTADRFKWHLLFEPIDPRTIERAVSQATITIRKNRSAAGRLHAETLKVKPIDRLPTSAPPEAKAAEQAKLRKGVKVWRGNHAQFYNSDGNHCAEIFELPNGKWQAVGIRRFDAVQANYRPGSTFRPQPTARLIMRLFVNDVVSMLDDAGRRSRYRVKKIAASNRGVDKKTGKPTMIGGGITLVDTLAAVDDRSAPNRSGDYLRRFGARIESIG